MSKPAGNVNAGVSARPRAGFVTGLACGIIFLTACALICVALRSRLPFPQVRGVSPKYEYFAAHRADYDVIFIGSSRFFHQVIPRQFDARVEAAAGRKIRSFNLAYDGVWPPESFYFLRQILKLKPPRLRWVVLDLIDIDARLYEQTNSTQRVAYWHDWQHTRLAWSEVDALQLPSPEKWNLTAKHSEHLFKQWINFGRGAELLRDRFVQRKEKPPKWIDAEGFQPGPDTPMTGTELAKLEKSVTRLKRGIAPSPAGPRLHRALSELMAEVRASGANLVCVISPTLNPKENFTGLPAGLPLFAFNDPNKHPQLYEAAVHYDAWHLNARGAEIFTDLLAAEFATHLKSER